MAFTSHRIFTKKLRDLIYQRGFNIAEFRREVGVSNEAMRNYTSPNTETAPVRPEVLRRMAERLGVGIEGLRAETNGDLAAAEKAVSAADAVIREAVGLARDTGRTDLAKKLEGLLLRGDQLDARTFKSAASTSAAAKRKQKRKRGDRP